MIQPRLSVPGCPNHFPDWQSGIISYFVNSLHVNPGEQNALSALGWGCDATGIAVSKIQVLDCSPSELSCVFSDSAISGKLDLEKRLLCYTEMDRMKPYISEYLYCKFYWNKSISWNATKKGKKIAGHQAYTERTRTPASRQCFLTQGLSWKRTHFAQSFAKL